MRIVKNDGRVSRIAGIGSLLMQEHVSLLTSSILGESHLFQMELLSLVHELLALVFQL